ncbi:hypothetical protein [Labilibacter marinus]|uniref:hypothetical protein n=1 Tax=Labilibacter marinus TaxID=1477105 RepID=UPI00082BB06D|nr:hypothetical protein [Labilibacter marinus]
MKNTYCINGCIESFDEMILDFDNIHTKQKMVSVGQKLLFVQDTGIIPVVLNEISRNGEYIYLKMNSCIDGEEIHASNSTKDIPWGWCIYSLGYLKDIVF